MLPRLPAADILVTNVFFLPAMVPLLRRGRGAVVLNVQRMPKGQLWLYSRAARLSANSTAIETAMLRERSSFAGRTVVIRNPIDVSVFTPPATPRDWRGEKTIIFTGRIHPEKGVHLLVDAFARLCRTRRDLRLRLVGPQKINVGGGGEAYLADLKSRAGGCPVEVCDPIYDRPSLATALRTAHIYVYPSLAEKGEAQPVAPIEAMATGLAPVVSNIPQFSDYIVDGQTGLVFDHRAADPVGPLASQLSRLLDDTELAERLGRAAANKAASFGYDAVAALHLEDFRRILEGPAGTLAGRSSRVQGEAV
jgi:glycosyltransferase involved in cell wall biosynthesis